MKNKENKTTRTTKIITVRMPADLAKEIRARAAESDSTVSRYFRSLINEDFRAAGLEALFLFLATAALLLKELYDFFQ